MSNEVFLNWTFSNEKNRGSFWYIIALSLVIGMVVWGFLTKQYVMGFLVILITGVYFFIENNTEESTTVGLTQLGIIIGHNFYEYTRFESFSIAYSGKEAMYLRLFFSGNINARFLELRIDNNIAIKLKEVLPNVLKEDPKAEISFTDKLIKLLKL